MAAAFRAIGLPLISKIHNGGCTFRVTLRTAANQQKHSILAERQARIACATVACVQRTAKSVRVRGAGGAPRARRREQPCGDEHAAQRAIVQHEQTIITQMARRYDAASGRPTATLVPLPLRAALLPVLSDSNMASA